MIVDEKRDNEIPISSNKPYNEEVVEVVEFDLCRGGLYTVSVHVPFSVHSPVEEDLNAACRIYMDGEDWKCIGEARQWDGELIANGGQWCSRPNVPLDGHAGLAKRMYLTKGHHIIRVCASGSSTLAVLTLRSRRHFQVWK